jgi:hypothetical protein
MSKGYKFLKVMYSTVEGLEPDGRISYFYVPPEQRWVYKLLKEWGAQDAREKLKLKR